MGATLTRRMKLQQSEEKKMSSFAEESAGSSFSSKSKKRRKFQVHLHRGGKPPGNLLARTLTDLMSTPQYKITNFNLYCTKGCCVRLDTNLIEKNKEVWMFGYLKCHIASSARYGYSSFDGGEIALSGCPESPTA